LRCTAPDAARLDGRDIGFEGHSLSLDAGDTDFRNPRTPVIVNLISALKTLKARYGDDFVLTVAPETFFVQLGYQYYGTGKWGGQDPRRSVPPGRPRPARRPDAPVRPGLQLGSDHGPRQP